MHMLGTGMVMPLQDTFYLAALLKDLSHLGGVFQTVVFPNIRVDILVHEYDGLARDGGEPCAESVGVGQDGVCPVMAACRMIGLAVRGEAGIEKEERFIPQCQVSPRTA